MSSIPETMTAIEIGQPGPPPVLRPVRRPVPVARPGEVLIRVAAAGVNRPDVLQRRGLYPPPPGVTDIPGLEVSGEIVDRAAEVSGRVVGDQVCALVAGGAYAEYVTAPAVQCLPIPSRMTLQDAAALPETFFTVYLNVFERAGLRPGEILLVHGGSSGIGTTAILLAKARGATVLVTAGSQRKCNACLSLGADRAINYREEDFVAATITATQGRGADVILDMVGGDYVPRNVEAAAEEGRISIIATQGGRRAELDLVPLLRKRLKLMASTLRPQSVASKGRLAKALEREIWPLFATSNLCPPIHARFPLVEAFRAHELMESGEHVGKILLIVKPDAGA